MGFANTTLPTPPMWLRHVLPWWLLKWISAHSRVCWVAMVQWKDGYPDWRWSDLSDCDPDCYCGKYMTEETRTAIADAQGLEAPF